MENKKSPAATGRNNGQTQNITLGTTEDSVPQFNPSGKLRQSYQARAERRAALRFVGQRIVFYGPSAYRLGRVSLGLRADVSFFDLDTDTLMDLARTMKEVLE